MERKFILFAVITILFTTVFYPAFSSNSSDLTFCVLAQSEGEATRDNIVESELVSAEVNLSSETSRESVDEAVDDSSIESVDEAVDDSSIESADEVVDDSSIESVDEAVDDSSIESVDEAVDDSSSESVDESISESMGESVINISNESNSSSSGTEETEPETFLEKLKAWGSEFKDDFYNNFIKENRWKLLTNGLLSTLKITFVALIIGVVIGVLIAAVRSTYDKNKASMKRRGGAGYRVLAILNTFCKLYLTVIRGTPMVVQLLIMYFVIFVSSNNGTMVAMISFGINSGAYVAEIIRGGIMSIDNGQFEAGRSLGFNYPQTMYHIILPQTFKAVLPSLCNEFIVLIKETSVAGYAGIMELTKAGETIRNRTFSPFMPLIAVALIYLVLVIILTKFVGMLERRLRKNER